MHQPDRAIAGADVGAEVAGACERAELRGAAFQGCDVLIEITLNNWVVNGKPTEEMKPPFDFTAGRLWGLLGILSPVNPHPITLSCTHTYPKWHLQNIFEQKSCLFTYLCWTWWVLWLDALPISAQSHPILVLNVVVTFSPGQLPCKQPFPASGSRSKRCSWLPVLGVYRMHTVHMCLRVAYC